MINFELPEIGYSFELTEQAERYVNLIHWLLKRVKASDVAIKDMQTEAAGLSTLALLHKDVDFSDTGAYCYTNMLRACQEIEKDSSKEKELCLNSLETLHRTATYPHYIEDFVTYRIGNDPTEVSDILESLNIQKLNTIPVLKFSLLAALIIKMHPFTDGNVVLSILIPKYYLSKDYKSLNSIPISTQYLTESVQFFYDAIWMDLSKVTELVLRNFYRAIVNAYVLQEYGYDAHYPVNSDFIRQLDKCEDMYDFNKLLTKYYSSLE